MKAIRVIYYEGDEEWLLTNLNMPNRVDKKGLSSKVLGGRGRRIKELTRYIIKDNQGGKVK
jgi:hypothetical protein